MIAFMERPLHYDFRDVLWAPARALSVKKIFAMTLFLCLGLAIYDLFTYIALAIQGENIEYVFSTYGFFPFYRYAFSSHVAVVVFALGLILTTLAVMMGFFAVSAIDIEEIRGNRFMSAGESIRFAFRRLTQLLLSEVAIAIFVLFIVILFAILGLASRIPWVGEWLYSLFFVFPGFIVAIFTVFIILVWQVSLVLLPATAASERRGEVFTALLETFSSIIRQPWRWLGFTVYSIVAAKLASFVYAYLCFRAVQFMTFAAGLGGGRERLTDLIKAGLSHLPVNSDLTDTMFNIFPGIDWSFSVGAWARGSADGAAGYIMAIMLFVIFATIAGYFMAIIATAQARGYVVIRYIKDNYRISDEKPLFFTDEPVNPPLEDEDIEGGGVEQS